MKKEEIVKYLANVYAVVASDGVVDRLEERLFADISREIGAGYFERKQAIELVEKESLPIQLDARWSDKIRNLEDMLLAAYCDGQLEPLEKKLIVDYANHLDISQKQLIAIKKEAQRRHAELH